MTGTRHQKKSGVGWEYVVAIDDHARVAFGMLHPDEKSGSACLVLLKAVRYYASLGILFVLIDNAACYRSHDFQRLCRRLGLKHRRTRLYSPRANGKAESTRFESLAWKQVQEGWA